MIATRFYRGQGLGNQIWAYIVTRVLALDKNFSFGIGSPEKFKGRDFLKLDYGEYVPSDWLSEFRPSPKIPSGMKYLYEEGGAWLEKYSCDVRGFDNKLLHVQDGTFLVGYFQSELYIEHRKKEILSWLTVAPKYNRLDFSDDNICVLNIRGGEYKLFPELILSRDYWLNAVKNMQLFNQNLKFIVITDDPLYAKTILPEFQAYHFSIGEDYAIINNARYLILSNSSFSFFPAWTNTKVRKIIAPKYWARHNVSDGFWACEFNLYKDWFWQDRDGILSSYEECLEAYKIYRQQNRISELKDRPRKSNSIIKNIINSYIDRVSRYKQRFR